MKVGIVGAGIAGLTTAVAFARRGAEVAVYERPGVSTSGAGISLFGNGLRALAAAGLDDAVRSLGTPAAVPAGLRTPRGTWLLRTPPVTDADLTVVGRSDLHDRLAAAAPPVRFATVAEVRGTARHAAVVLDTGETHTFDLVVGADGVASGIRRSWPDDPGIRYAGYTAWRGITADPVGVRAAGETWGRGERFGIAPMAGGHVYWFATAAAPPASPAADEKAELLRRFAAWHDPIPALLDGTDDAAILRNDVVDLAAPLPRFVRGRVVLVGDAAHAMTPDLGQGGNQALEDAVTLAALAARHDDIGSALAGYDVLRRRRTAVLARRSRQVGRIAHARNPVTVAVRNALMRLVPAGSATRATTPAQAWRPPADAGDQTPTAKGVDGT